MIIYIYISIGLLYLYDVLGVLSCFVLRSFFPPQETIFCHIYVNVCHV